MKYNKEEIIQSFIREIEKDVRQMDFGQVIIVIQNNYPSRIIIARSKTYKNIKKIKRGVDSPPSPVII